MNSLCWLRMPREIIYENLTNYWYDEKAKAIADDFNNGGHSVTIDNIEFKINKNEKKKECKNKKTSFWKRLFGY